MAKKSNMVDKFFEIFAGEYVEIITSLKTVHEIQSEEGFVSQTLPFYVYGYLLDTDDDYIYLGEHPNNVSKVVSRKEVKAMEIHKEVDLYEEMLDSVEAPKNKKDFN